MALPETSQPGHSHFVTTHWSIVLRCSDDGDLRAQSSLEYLCATYWYPLYAYVRRKGYSVEDSQDLTQQFFSRLLEKRVVDRADPARGRFRSFLLTALDHFLANEWARGRALKRGGGLATIPLQMDSAETRYGVEPMDERTPEQAFEYSWALALLERVLKKLQEDYRAKGQEELFKALEPSIALAPASKKVAELTRNLGMSEGAMRVALHRLRTRYRELLREEIGATLDSPSEIDAEMQHLFEILSRK